MRRARFATRMSTTFVAGMTMILIGTQGALAQPSVTWTSLAPLPSIGQGVEGMAVGMISGQIIAATGFDPGTNHGDTDYTRIYDIASNTWTTDKGVHPPGGVRSESGAVVVGGKLYMIGGETRAGVMANADVFDPVANTWTALSNLPDLPPNSHGRSKPDKKAGLAVAAVGNAIYAIGGRDVQNGPCSSKNPKDELYTVEKYDIPSNTWSFVSPIPPPKGSSDPGERISDASAIAIDGEIYVFGGCTVSKTGAAKFYRDIWKYDPPTDAWTKVGNLPTPRGAFSQIAAIGTTVYVFGGWEGGSNPPLADVFTFDPTTGDSADLCPTGQEQACMPHPRGEMGVVAYNGSIYTVGGSLPAFGNSTNVMDEFTP